MSVETTLQPGSAAWLRSKDTQFYIWHDTRFDPDTVDEIMEYVARMVEESEQPGEFERFRSALRSIASNTCCDGCREAALVARKALGDE
jgi:hypothetical protein